MVNIGLGIFLILFGILFASMPLFSMIFSAPPIGICVFLSIFVFAGFSTSFSGIKMIVNHIKKKNVAKNGIRTVGNFVSIKNHNSTYYEIIFNYKRTDGTIAQQTTSENYSYETASYFRELGSFAIKYIDNTAVITQEINYNLLTPEQQYRVQGSKYNGYNTVYKTKDDTSTVVVHDNTNTVEEKKTKTYFSCPYCGNTQETVGKCNNCGARVGVKDKKEL